MKLKVGDKVYYNAHKSYLSPSKMGTILNYHPELQYFVTWSDLDSKHNGWWDKKDLVLVVDPNDILKNLL